jgi:hypothetical protein
MKVHEEFPASGAQTGNYRLLRTIVVSLVVLLCCLGVYILEYNYLNLRTNPIKSDAIVLFIGPGLDKRVKEAHQLMYEGYADTLLIPAYHQVFILSGQHIVNAALIPRINKFAYTTYPAFYEKTHIEAIKAKDMMDKLGFNSAIMVSAPCHMRRISIICSHIFNPKKHQIGYVGSRYLRASSILSVFSLHKFKFVVAETVKIIAFIFYEKTKYTIYPTLRKYRKIDKWNLI